ncbi:MAG: glycosyl hydrolase family 8 [Pseudomonadota bacterium]
MRRRFFLQSATSAAVVALTGCGGGGGGSAAGTATDTSATSTTPSTSAPSTGGPSAQQQQAATATASAAAAYPFGARIDKYVAGIAPTQSAAAMDSLLKTQYTAWRNASIVSADSIVSGGYAVRFSNTSYLMVSEGAGYGLLLAALFAGHDPQAQQLFDGLLAVVRARPAWAVSQYDPNGKYLHEWRLNANGTSGGEGWNAMDGDLDIAMALLMADRQWGSSGTWNYKQEATNTIAALKSWNMNSDGSTRGLPSAKNNRTSDYMIGHFRAFKAATGDDIWDKAVDKAYKLLDRMQTVYSPGVGLMPDFVINTDSETPAPSTGYIGDGNDKEGYFWWNACRNPWRFSSDFVLSGDTRFSLVTGRMIDFFQNSSKGDPANIGMGYALDGTILMGGNFPGGNSAAYHGPICAGAVVDARFQGFLDTMWNWNATHLTTGYYDSEIQLLSMAVASGNWWSTAKR